MTTKGELTFSVIITAVIAIIVLMVVILIFTGKLNLANRGLEHCGGNCISSTSVCNSGYQLYPIGDPECKRVTPNTPTCCRQILPDS